MFRSNSENRTNQNTPAIHRRGPSNDRNEPAVTRTGPTSEGRSTSATRHNPSFRDSAERNSEIRRGPASQPSLSEIRRRIDRSIPDASAASRGGRSHTTNTRSYRADNTQGPKGHDRSGNAERIAGPKGGHPDAKSVHRRPPMVVRPHDSGKGSLKHVRPDTIGHARAHTVSRGADFKHLTHGTVARGIHLDRQYDLYHKGDVARRLDMYHPKHHPGPPRGHAHLPGVGHPIGYVPHHIYRGRISPVYRRSGFSFSFAYFGPGYYLSFGLGDGPSYWYPHWDPWVRWSWYHHCRPVWDPRPLWCRPVVYVPARTWVWWEVPVWTPMPMVASGTWVDVPPVVVPPAQSDLQLLAVRFVDPGHPDEKLGPRYRVWIRNNSNQEITQPFDVLLLAGNDEKLAAELPRAGARIVSIGPNQTQAVDIRLPFDAMQIGRDAQGKPVPFSTLHVLVDANREIQETSEVNNGTRLTADLVLPVDPAAFEIEPKSVRPGGQVLLAGEGLGPAPGKVLVHLGGIEMEAEILGWYDLGVRFTAPNLPVAGPTQAEVIILRADGTATNPIALSLDPAAPEAIPVPAPVAPANP
ncbi:MAG: hypothetical protein JW818_09390 [Pirellulales bacterium]|nr:hypothetical protein [Pirellulales bacterium]